MCVSIEHLGHHIYSEGLHNNNGKQSSNASSTTSTRALVISRPPEQLWEIVSKFVLHHEPT